MKLTFYGGPYNGTVREHPNAPDQIDFPKEYVMFLIHKESEIYNLNDKEFYNYLLVEKTETEAMYEYINFSSSVTDNKKDIDEKDIS